MMLGDGMTMKEISSRLHICTKTVEFHWAKARAMLGLRSYVDCCKFCIRHGLIKL